MVEVVLEHGSKLIKLALGDRFKHVLLVLCVVEKTAALARRAELVQHLEVICEEGLEDLLWAE